MAKDTKDDEKDEAEQPKKNKSGKVSGVVKIVAIVFGVLLLLSATVGISVFVTTKMLHTASSDEGADQTVGTDQPDAKGKDSKGKKDSKDKDKAAGKKGSKGKADAIYFAFDPPIVVNFQQMSNARFLQVTIEVMTHDPEVVTALQTHMPVIRNNLVMLLSSQSADQLMSIEGKQKIRAEALAEVQTVLEERVGKPGVEELYFTSFVMQ